MRPLCERGHRERVRRGRAALSLGGGRFSLKLRGKVCVVRFSIPEQFQNLRKANSVVFIKTKDGKRGWVEERGVRFVER